VKIETVFVEADARALRRALKLVWYPFARLEPLEEEGWCVGVDCFVASLMGSAYTRLLLSRKVETSMLRKQPTIEAPILEPVKCGPEVLDELRSIGKERGKSETSSFSSFEPVDYYATRMLGSRMALKRLEMFFRSFTDASAHVHALVNELKPERLTYKGILYILLYFDVQERVFLLIDRSSLRSTLHEKFLRREHLRERGSSYFYLE